jgi:hypothetical protein
VQLVNRVLGVALSFALGACGGGRAQEPQAAAPVTETDAEPEVDAGAPEDAGPPERPFARSAEEATELMSAAVDAHREAVAACVEEYRARKKLGGKRVEVQVGIDQEGNLLGATLTKGKKDEKLSECMHEALATAVFPRSQAGVMTITRSFEEILQ